MSECLFLGDQRLDPDSEAGQQALASVHGTRAPVSCRCTSKGALMYVAMIDDTYVVKRMPGTGGAHAPSCTSFEPPEHLSGLSELQGSAISEEPEDGSVLLKLDFPLTKTGKRTAPPPASAGQATEAISNPKKMGLTALQNFLWQEGDLTKWVPAMEGKRWWGPVRRALQRAAHGKTVKGIDLSAALFVPEVFKQEIKAEIAARNKAKLAAICSRSETAQSLGLIIAEYKSHEPTRLGARFSFKHAPDVAFFADADLTGRFERVFEAPLELLDMVEGARAITIASFGMSAGGYPVLQQIGMMLVDKNWLPFEHMREHELLEQAISQTRRFSNQMRYNLPSKAVISTLVLSDTDPACALFVTPPAASAEQAAEYADLVEETEFKTWLWRGDTVMPELPSRSEHSPSESRIERSGQDV